MAAASIPHYSMSSSFPSRQSIKFASHVPSSSRNSTFKPIKVSSSSSEPDPAIETTDPVQLAFAKARAYKKAIQSNVPIPKISPNPVLESSGSLKKNAGSVSKFSKSSGDDAPVLAGLMEQIGNQYKDNKKDDALSEVLSDSTSKVKASSSLESEPVDNDPVKLAFARARAYKTAIQSNNPTPEILPNPALASSQDLTKGDGFVSELTNNGDTMVFADLLKQMAKQSRGNNEADSVSEEDFPEVEIIVGDASKFGNATASNPRTSLEEDSGLHKPKIASWRNPLTPSNILRTDGSRSENTSPGEDFPKVEIIVENANKFEDVASVQPKSSLEIDSDLYQPTTSSWGIFPRPKSISKAYGGGRVIRPGEMLETAEEKAAKDARTRQLIADYKDKISKTVEINPRVKAECEEELLEGDSLMNCGKLTEALSLYQNVMEKLPYQSELHGLAALQWSICQDSLCRPNQARVMYEKLKTHPNAQISKKAKHFAFGFEAMEMLKVKSSTPVRTNYQRYFDAFVEDKADYSLTETEGDQGVLSQALPYILFLASPLFFVLIAVVQKRI